MSDITTVRDRDALRPRHSPYWRMVSRGCYIGFRKVSASAQGSWVARFRDDDGKQHVTSLGAFEDLPASDRYGRASAAAQEWFSRMGRGHRDTGATVADACRAYVQTLGDAGKKDAEGRFRRWVFSDLKFSNIALAKLRLSHVKAWRAALERTPAIPQDKASKEPRKARSAASVNRDMTALRAALNLALEDGHVSTDDAWRTALRPVENASRRRTVYLDAAQRRKLIDAAQPDLQPLLRALCALPLRPGAVASLKVANYERRTGELTIGRDKAGQDRRITLPPVTRALFEAASAGKTPDAPLFARADGKSWDKDAWKYPLKAAVQSAELQLDATAYALRHSTITDLLALHKLDTLTVAMVSGTSLQMIEKHYGHLVRQHAADALAKLAV